MALDENMLIVGSDDGHVSFLDPRSLRSICSVRAHSSVNSVAIGSNLAVSCGYLERSACLSPPSPVSADAASIVFA